MTREQAKALWQQVRDFGEGKEVEFYSEALQSWRTVRDHAFDSPDFQWRTKPEPKHVPLTEKDIPALCWLRSTNGRDYMVVGVNSDGINLCLREGLVGFTTLMNNGWQYSTDSNREHWRPCWKEEV